MALNQVVDFENKLGGLAQLSFGDTGNILSIARERVLNANLDVGVSYVKHERNVSSWGMYSLYK